MKWISVNIFMMFLWYTKKIFIVNQNITCFSPIKL